MASEIIYMLGVIAVGFAVNYALRALPFLLFGGRDRAIPAWIDRLSGFISPVIIAGLIVYSYSGSAWRTPWPYLAGAVTIALQVWKRNPLVSIVAGTAVYMLLLNCCGCATQRQVYLLDAKNPELRMTASGVYMGEERIAPEDVPGALEDAEIPKDRAIHILLDRDMRDLRAPRALMALLSRGGYTRSILVTSEHGASANQSGRSYAKEASEGRFDDDFVFYVTPKGVTYGLLTPVGPDEVAKCLANGEARTDSLIRICGLEKDYQSPEVMPIMLELEDRLRKAGYVNVRRFWLKSSNLQGARTRNLNPGTLSGRRAPAPARTSKGIRYKRADE